MFLWYHYSSNAFLHESAGFLLITSSLFTLHFFRRIFEGNK
nr:MAG TPA: hypothetical protein [Caudoviricetes sp.]